jgi:hypothetical protein
MKFSELTPETIEKLKTRRYDRIVEKHEGPETWKWQIERGECQFIETNGHFILLPVYLEQIPNITILRVIESKDGGALTVFLKDTTYYDDDFMSGFLAVCEKFAGENFYTATVYHEWFILDNLK